jgi:hypothetical protein
MPAQKFDRTLCFDYVGENNPPLILVVDGFWSVGTEGIAISRVQQLLNKEIGFTYTTTLRCFGAMNLTSDERHDANSRCSVWTNMLLNGRALVIGVPQAMEQMKVEGHKPGDLFRHARLGVVLVIPGVMTPEMDMEFSSYQAKVARALKVLKL